ncbi:MAG: esterase [Bacillales bacterium]|nr:esterase [Bacillales bacterium]
MEFEHTLMNSLGIEVKETTKEKVIMTMPVDERTRQPFGLLHGGASVALAETVASYGGFLNIDPKSQGIVGLEINANHIKGKKSGIVTAVGTPLHIGKTTQVWETRISDEVGELICISRCTIAVISLKK